MTAMATFKWNGSKDAGDNTAFLYAPNTGGVMHKVAKGGNLDLTAPIQTALATKHNLPSDVGAVTSVVADSHALGTW